MQRCSLSCAFGLILGCASHSPIKPAEVLDERTGMTVGVLHKPIELVQSTEIMPSAGQRISFAYLGPVEWDNMGDIRYGLWIHLAPGNDWRFDNIRNPGAVTLTLDDGAKVLSGIEPPELEHGALSTRGFVGADGVLRSRLADAQTHGGEPAKIELDFKRASDTPVRFTARTGCSRFTRTLFARRGYWRLMAATCGRVMRFRGAYR